MPMMLEYNKLKETSDTWKVVFLNTITSCATAVKAENYRKFRELFPVPRLEKGYDLFRVPQEFE